MYITANEIFNQYKALEKTYDYFMDNIEKIRGFLKENTYKSITYTGCGSGYTLCQSGEMSVKVKIGIPANAIAGGDLMINFPLYKNILKDTLLVVPSRSGNTSEVVNAVKMIKKELGCPCISICATENSEMSKLSDLSLEMPWAFDESVCQTRTVTTLYMANLMLIAIMGNDEELLEEIRYSIEQGEGFIKDNTEALKKIAENEKWDKVVVLGDCELQGIASEGALAFKEISQLQSNYYHILDVRHGPMVLVDDKTLVIVACSPLDKDYQRVLVSDFKKRGAVVVTVNSMANNDWGANYNIVIPPYKNYGVIGIPFIFVPQAISFFKALSLGVNPDTPPGLNSWIKL